MNLSEVTLKKRKIAIVTGTRAEYGLLYLLMREIQQDSSLELQLIVSSMHLSPEFGLSYQFIEQDGFKIDAKVEMLLSSDTAVGVAKSIGLGVIGFADAFSRLNPDIILLLGDRFECLAAAQTAMICKIPVAHIHGGELSEGAVDDAIRHSITKMSCLHFVAADAYRKRVIQLGEMPDNVYNFGAPGLERISHYKLLNREQLEKEKGFSFGEVNFFITYHPATLEMKDNDQVFNALLKALDAFPEAMLIFTKANADETGRLINAMIDAYVTKNNLRAVAFTTLGDLNYLSTLKIIDVVIGNSSSGIIEAPYFKKPTVNIGNRQANRLRSSSIIDCTGKTIGIIHAIKKALSVDFKSVLKNTAPAYTVAKTAFKIKNKLKSVNLKKIQTKHFYDIEGSND